MSIKSLQGRQTLITRLKCIKQEAQLSSAAWVIGARGELNYAAPKSHEMSDAALLPAFLPLSPLLAINTTTFAIVITYHA